MEDGFAFKVIINGTGYGVQILAEEYPRATMVEN